MKYDKEKVGLPMWIRTTDLRLRSWKNDINQ